MSTRPKNQQGFSLMELLIALMIIGVIATMGLRMLRQNADKARYESAKDRLRNVAMALDTYYLSEGKYPEFSSWEQMIDGNSILVKKNLIQVNMPKEDGWGQPFEGKSSKNIYELKCQGDPNAPEDRPLVTWEPGKGLNLQGGGTGGEAKPTGDKAAAPAGDKK